MPPTWLAKMLGQEQQYVAPPLPPGEQVQQTFAGSAMSGRRPAWGAQLGLAPSGLVVSPMNTIGAQRILGLGARAVGVPGFGGFNYLVNQAKPEPQVIPYSDITAVGPGSRGGFYAPPTVRVETSQGALEYGVTGSLWTLSRSQRAAQAQQQLLAELAARAGGQT